MTIEKNALRIIRAEVEAFKGIVRLAEVTPSGDVIQITGKNGAGKSSLIDGVEWVLTGKILGKKPARPPVHRGKEFARGLVDLGNSTVERRVTAEGREQVVVRTADGATFDKPQTRLDRLFDALAFDPLAYNRMKPAEQRETLLRLAGVDLADLDEQREATYQRRRDVNRDHKTALARIGDRIQGAPKEAVDLAGIDAEVEKAQEAIRANDLARSMAVAGARNARLELDRAADCRAEVDRVRILLGETEARATKLEASAAAAAKNAEKEAAIVAALNDPDLDALHDKRRSAREANELHRERAARIERKAEARALAEKSERLTAKLEEIDAEKAAALAAADMPVEGLGVSDDGVTFNGNPFEEEPTSKAIEVCTAIGAALNPRLNIALIRDGNDFDDDTFAAFVSYCAGVGLQAWVEKISPVGEDGVVVIEAGEVKS